MPVNFVPYFYIDDCVRSPKEDETDDDSDSEVEFYYSEVDVNPHDFPELFTCSDDADQQPRFNDNQHVPASSAPSRPDHANCWPPPQHEYGSGASRPITMSIPVPGSASGETQVVVVGSVQDRHLAGAYGTSGVGHQQQHQHHHYPAGFHASSAPAYSHMEMAMARHGYENNGEVTMGYPGGQLVGSHPR